MGRQKETAKGVWGYSEMMDIFIIKIDGYGFESIEEEEMKKLIENFLRDCNYIRAIDENIGMKEIIKCLDTR